MSVVIEVSGEGYVEQIKDTITVSELIDKLYEYVNKNPETKVYIGLSSGQFCGITEENIKVLPE